MKRAKSAWIKVFPLFARFFQLVFTKVLQQTFDAESVQHFRVIATVFEDFLCWDASVYFEPEMLFKKNSGVKLMDNDVAFRVYGLSLRIDNSSSVNRLSFRVP